MRSEDSGLQRRGNHRRAARRPRTLEHLGVGTELGLWLSLDGACLSRRWPRTFPWGGGAPAEPRHSE